MKTALIPFFFLALASFFAPASHGQDFVLSSFQCDPSSCTEQTAPTAAGSAFVSFNGTCTGGAVATVEGSALAQIGIDGACSTPFVARATVSQSTSTQLDDFGCPFNLSTITQIAQILTPLLTVVFTDTQGLDCQGGTFGPTNNGTRPC